MQRVLDLVVLAVGAVTVLVAVVLFGVLPETQRTARQFEAAFGETAVDGAPQEASLAEGVDTDLAFAVAQGNLSRLRLTLAFSDDVAASDPDFLRIQVIDPAGVLRDPVVTTANPLPMSDGATPPGYAAVPRTVDVEVAVNDKPERQVVTAAHRDETPEQAAARVAGGFSADGSGTWTVRLSIAAGDCPAPALDPARSGACRSVAPTGEDPGNPVQVVRFQTLHWSARLSPVEG